MCRPMWRCMVTEAIRSRMVWVITGVLALLVLLALPAKAESADYETTLDRLGRLQALAEQYIEEKNSGDDPIDLTLSFTRVGDYNTTVWQLTAGTRDGEFEKYATDADPDLWDLQGMNTVELPNGGEPYAITVDLSGIGRMLKWAGFILLTVQIISLIANLFRNAGTIRRTLRPIQELAATAARLNSMTHMSRRELEALAGELSKINATHLDLSLIHI